MKTPPIKLILFVSVILCSFFYSCKSDSTTDPATKANIIGSVNLYNDGTVKMPKDGMTVLIEGSDPAITAVTDTSGSFVMSDVPFGTYNLIFSKSGYGLFKKTGFFHSNTGSSSIVSPSPSLGQNSTTTISSLTSSTSLSNIELCISTLPAPTSNVPRYIRVFFSKSSHVSFYNYEKYTAIYKHLSNPANFELRIKDLNNLGYSSGDTVYAKVYGDSFWSNDYDNLTTGKHEFPNLNETSADAVYFVVP